MVTTANERSLFPRLFNCVTQRKNSHGNEIKSEKTFDGEDNTI